MNGEGGGVGGLVSTEQCRERRENRGGRVGRFRCRDMLGRKGKERWGDWVEEVRERSDDDGWNEREEEGQREERKDSEEEG